MGKLVKLSSILLVISVLALSLAACTPGGSATTLIVTIDTPQDGTTVTASPVTVSGRVNKTATVKINDVAVPVKGGKFSTSLNISEGTNLITVVATSGEKTVTKTVTVTYTPTK